MKTDILRLERDVLHFLRSYFTKDKDANWRWFDSQEKTKQRVRKPTVKEMAKHPKLLRKQRRLVGVS